MKSKAGTSRICARTLVQVRLRIAQTSVQCDRGVPLRGLHFVSSEKKRRSGFKWCKGFLNILLLAEAHGSPNAQWHCLHRPAPSRRLILSRCWMSSATVSKKASSSLVSLPNYMAGSPAVCRLACIASCAAVRARNHIHASTHLRNRCPAL